AANSGHSHPVGTPDVDFPPTPNDFPPVGAVLDAVRPAEGGLPTWVRVGPLMRRNNGTVLHGQLPGFLGPSRTSFVIDQELVGENVKVRAIERADDLTSMRMSARRDLVEQFQEARRLIDHSREARDLNAYYQRAFSLLTSGNIEKAFD